MTVLECERLAPEAIDAGDWDRLAEESRNLFATREFLSSWWRHFGQGSPEFTVCRDGAGRAVGLLPLYTRRRAGLTVARFAGHGPGDHLGPIAGREARPEVGAALRRTLADLGCDLLVAEHVPVDDGWQSVIGGHVVRDDAAPLITGESWESYSQSRSSHFRRKLRWQMRRLAQEGEVTMRVSDASTLERDLETLFRLHGTRWGGADGLPRPRAVPPGVRAGRARAGLAAPVAARARRRDDRVQLRLPVRRPRVAAPDRARPADHDRLRRPAPPLADARARVRGRHQRVPAPARGRGLQEPARDRRRPPRDARRHLHPARALNVVARRHRRPPGPRWKTRPAGLRRPRRGGRRPTSRASSRARVPSASRPGP